MAIRNVGGHGVSSSAPHHHQFAQAAQPKFPDTTGPAAYTGPSSSPVRGGLPGGKKGGKASNAAQAPNKSVSKYL